jgi:hypothetical protein
VLRVVFQDVKTVDIRNKLISKLYQHFRERDLPCGLQDSLCTLALHLVRGFRHSAAGPTLDTGGWLTLTRRGLSPRKRRQASLGAITNKQLSGVRATVIPVVARRLVRAADKCALD